MITRGMRILYHLWLSPFCRKVRIVLAEKQADFSMKVEQVWERRREFLALNPACDVPVLVEADGTVLSYSAAICEYLEETLPSPNLIGHTVQDRAEVRRLVAWFDQKYNAEVTDRLVGEKIMKQFLGLGQPDSRLIRAALADLHTHLQYITYLVERRDWLGGSELSLADIAAGAHLSCVDYLGDIPWDDYGTVKEWYARIKSRPSFQPILDDAIPGLPAPKHYADLDF